MLGVCIWKQGPSIVAGGQSGSLLYCVGFVIDPIAAG